jgi:hypothetical protein
VIVDPLRTLTVIRGPEVGGADVGGRVVAGAVVAGRVVDGVVAGVVVAGAVVAGAVVAGAVEAGVVVVAVRDGVTPGVPLMTPCPLSKPPPHELNATSSAMTADTAMTP